ncbi:MAG: undecaprenyl-phosphate glucose phosphotransferase, partial [Devosia sp.]|nr:undecaprenyl-phosphate glucose phosphotransferase [Devosia sp.]
MFHLDPQQAVLEHVAQPPKAKAAPLRLSDLAAALADQPIAPTYSAAVVAGVAQVIEVALLVATGVVLFGLNGGDTLLSVVTTLGVVAVAEVFIGLLRLHGVAAYRLGISQLWKAALGWTAAFALLGGLVLLY